MERYMRAVKSLGMTITDTRERAFTAEINTNRGLLVVDCGNKGTARIEKPNGSIKYLYEKTPAQLRSALNQTIEANK